MTRLDQILTARVSRRTVFKGAGAAGLGIALTPALSFVPSTSAIPSISGKGANLLQSAGMIRAAAQESEDVQTIINIAITAEALAVTLLGGAIASAEAGDYDQEIPELVIDILKAARAEEQLHYEYLAEAGAEPLTTTFTVPDPALLTSYDTLFGTIVALETAFIAAYMAAAHRFAELGQTELVKVAYQVAGVEAEHRVLANYALGVRPANNVAFEEKLFSTVGEAAAALTALGFIGGDGIEVEYPGPGEIDYSNVTVTSAEGPSVDCGVPDEAFGGVVLTAPLTGGEEVPGPGDSDGFGHAKIIVNVAEGQICFRLSVARIDQATAAHIHAGPRGVAGDVVVPLAAPGPDGLINACTLVSAEIAQAIIDNPENYYVNVHNASYPGGALRGQLQHS